MCVHKSAFNRNYMDTTYSCILNVYTEWERKFNSIFCSFSTFLLATNLRMKTNLDNLTFLNVQRVEISLQFNSNELEFIIFFLSFSNNDSIYLLMLHRLNENFHFSLNFAISLKFNCFCVCVCVQMEISAWYFATTEIDIQNGCGK